MPVPGGSAADFATAVDEDALSRDEPAVSESRKLTAQATS